MSVVRIREAPYYRGFFKEEMYENFVGTWETVRNREVSVLERCPHGEVRLYYPYLLKYLSYEWKQNLCMCNYVLSM